MSQTGPQYEEGRQPQRAGPGGAYPGGGSQQPPMAAGGPPGRGMEPGREPAGAVPPERQERSEGMPGGPMAEPAGAGTAPGSSAPAPAPGMNQPGMERGAQPGGPGATGTQADRSGQQAGLLPWHEAEGYGRRWEGIQNSFVDDPRGAVQQADALVVEVLERVVTLRRQHQDQLRQGIGDQASTEDLRTSMRSYRELFEGLLR